MSVVAVLSVAAGCSRTSEPVSGSPPETVSQAPSPSTFAGAWRSVTPGLEFIRLQVHSKSSEEGVLAARLTFSGVAWEGGGRIVGDSLVTIMAVTGTTASGVMVARAADAQTLRVQMRPTSGAVTDLMFVREN